MNEQGYPLISVIIPAYNSGATVTRAVESVLSQSYPEIEVIVIDDGSSDDTSDKVRVIAENDKRVRLIIKPNGGVSAARNDGIMAAQGDWFVTLDADDYIDKEMLEALYEAAERTEADTVMCGFRMVFDDGKKTVFKVEDDYTDDSDTFLDNMLTDLYDLHMISTHSNQLYNTAIVKKNRIFYNEKLAVNEDIDYVLRYLKYCKTIGVIKGVFLNYVQHGYGESLITTFQTYGVASSILVLRDCNELLLGIKASDETFDEMNNRLFLHICSFLGLMYYRSGYSDERKLAEIKELCEKEEFEDLLEDLRPKGVKAVTAAWLLKNGMYESYHKLCMKLYSSQKMVVTGGNEIATTPDEPYRMLGIYSNINPEHEEAKAEYVKTEKSERTEADMPNEAIDTDFIMQALEKSADESAAHSGHQEKKRPKEPKKDPGSTQVTLEDILKVREILNEENR